MPMSLSITDLAGAIINTINEHHPSTTTTDTLNKHFLFATSPHIKSTGYYLPTTKKLDPFNRQSYIMSPVDMLRHQYDPSGGMDQHQQYPALSFEDHYSLSSLDSSNSSVSGTTSPPPPPPPQQQQQQNNKPKSKKQSYGRLLREIRRLRSENINLHNSVNTLKEDLLHERESRQIAEQVHRKYFEDSIDQHTQLELEILDQQEELTTLRSRLDNTTNSSIDSYKSPLLFFGVNDSNNQNDKSPLVQHHDHDHDDDYDYDDDQDDTTNTPSSFSIYQPTKNDDDDDDDDDEPDHDEEDDDKHKGIDDQFEDLAVSYLRQALVSNLTSARANLEFDDLMLKYDPSPDRVLRTLADAFLGWVCDTLDSNTTTTTTTTTTMNHEDKATCVARLMATQVQDVFIHFWKAILERYVHNDQDQYQFLHQTECSLQQQHNTSNDKNTTTLNDIVQNFHRLLVMLYKYDIVDSDAVTTWWHTLPSSLLLSNDNDSSTDQQRRQDCVTNQLRDVTRKFVEWVDEDDEDEDEDDDEDDEERDENGNNDDNDDDETACLSDTEIGQEMDNIDADDHPFTTIPSPTRPEKQKKSVSIQL